MIRRFRLERRSLRRFHLLLWRESEESRSNPKERPAASSSIFSVSE
jgi:hypothetical protein